MIRFVAPRRALTASLACAFLATGLVACGGGGGGGSAPPDSGGSGSGTESAYLLAEFVASDVNHQTVRVWDPAHPATTVQSVSIVQDSGIAWTSSHLVFSDATSYDAANRTVTTLGHARVFFDNNGKLCTIDLRGGHSHAPVQLSSATDVFRPVKAFPLTAAGDDAWVDAQGSSHHWAVRTTMGAADGATSIWQIVAALRDAATGLPQYFFVSLGSQSGTAVDPLTYEVVTTAFAQVAVPEVAAMDSYDSLVGLDPAQPGLGYLLVDSGLHALRWSAAGVSVDAASLHTFGVTLGALPAVADAASLYVADQTQLLSVSNGVVATLGSLSAVPDLLVDAGTWIAAREPVTATVSSTDYAIETMGKTSHATTIVEAGTEGVQLLGATSQVLVLAGTAEQGQAFVLASGDNASRQTVGAQYVGLVWPAAAPLDRAAAPVGLLSCVAAATGYCGAGALTQTTLATAASTALGTLAASAAIVRGDAIAGLAGSLGGQTLLSTTSTGFGTNEANTRDAWQFLPASAGSLTRVTSYLP